MLTIDNSKLSVCLTLTTAISRSRTTEQIYTAALDALESGLGVAQASILLFDSDRVMRFKAAITPASCRSWAESACGSR
jgi:hypothetical protein